MIRYEEDQRIRLINELSYYLKEIIINDSQLDFQDARKRINGWIDNFRGLISNLDPCFKTLESIKILDDKQIIRDSMDFLKMEADQERTKTFYTCLGAESESSARIMRLLNSKEGYSPNLHSLLDEISLSDALISRIVFIDDFLNSGGQFVKIFNNWCGVAYSQSEEVLFTCSKDIARKTLKPDSLEKLKKIKIVCLFANGMETGRMRAVRCLKDLGLNGSIHCLQTYSDACGMFGDRNEMEAFRGNLDKTVGGGSIFQGWQYSDVADFLSICEAAGEALLRSKHGNRWDDAKVKNRILGYGNSAQLYLTQANVPTCTLTCLWAEGEITINGQTLCWKPLLPRRTKAIGGSEGEKKISAQTVIKNTPDDLLNRLKLDFAADASAPIDITLVVSLDFLPTAAIEKNWILAGHAETQGWMAYTGFLNKDIRKILDITDNHECGSGVFLLSPDIIAPVNNHLHYEWEKNLYPVKLKSVHVSVFGGLAAFMSIRIQFSGGPETLRQTLQLSHQLSIINPRMAKASADFVQKRSVKKNDNLKRASLRSIFRWAEDLLNGENTKADIWNDDRGLYPDNRAMVILFLREKGELFKLPDNAQNALIDVVGGLSRVGKDTGRMKKSKFGKIDLDSSAVITFSENGIFALCGADISSNRSYLADHIQQHYVFLFLFVFHLKKLAGTIYTKTDNGRISQDIINILDWLAKFKVFPFHNVSSKPYMNQFLESLSLELKIQEIIGKVLSEEAFRKNG